jgi:hypothetical protein
MKLNWQAMLIGVCALLSVSARSASAQFAAAVVSYAPGTTAALGFATPAAALGSPERFTGEGVFPGVVSPFNPPFLASEIVSIGEGGSLTLRLSHFAVPQAGGPEIGVFTNVGLIETDFPNGQAGSPVGAFGIDSAVVDVSANGTDWVSLGNVTFDIPSNGYTDLTNPFADSPGSALSDFQQPLTLPLGSFNGLRYSDAGAQDMRELLSGSGGGKWIDISGSGLSQVGFVRFSVLDDMSAANLNFEFDAVSVSHAALGGATVPEPSTMVFLMTAFAALAASGPRRCPAWRCVGGRQSSE